MKEVHDAPAVRGSIIANMLQEHDNPFTLYPYDTNYLIYTQTSDLNKEAIASYDWAENARKDEVSLIRKNPGGNCPIAKSLHRFVKPTTNRNCSSVLPPITVLQVGRCAMWRWGITTTLTGVQTRPPAAGTAFILA